MNSMRKTKKQLIEELDSLKERVLELEALEKASGQSKKEFGEKIGRYFPQVEHMDEAIYVIFDRKYEFVNNQFAKLFDVTPDEVCSPEFDPMKLVAPESRKLVTNKYKLSSSGEFMTQQFEFTAMKNDGSRIECETFILLIPYKWGVAIHGMLRNISVRKRIDEELQRNRSDLQIVLNSIPTSIYYMDTNHRFIQANKAFCKSIGFPMESIIGKTLTDIFPNLPTEQLSHFYETNNAVLNTGNPKRGFIEVLPSIRGRRWIQNDRIPYVDEKGKIIGLICIAIDISELRETEEKLWYLSFHDVLTGLYNRTYFEEELYRLENGRQFPISVITVKIDNLQKINIHEGIAAGNELLRRTAKILKIFRTEDVTARISGDKFAILLPTADKSIGEEAILRLGKTLESNNKHHKVPLNLSFGAATVRQKGRSLINVLKEAEAAIA
ncbi:MAG: diguanylate cyclase [Proteobacteria bacterium]|nr:diguanylate cyclase [Pseudomonadota bacterium]